MRTSERAAGDIVIIDVSGRIQFGDGADEFRGAVTRGIDDGRMKLLLNMADVPYVGLVTSQAEMKSHRDLVQKTIAALLEGAAWVRANRDALQRPMLLPAEIMRAIYHRILEQIEASRYQVFGPRISLPPWRRLATAVKIWFGLHTKRK